MMRPIHFKVGITEQVFVRGQKLHYREQPRLWVFPLVVFAVLFWNVLGEDDSIIAIAVNAVLSLLVVGCALAFVWWSLGRSLRRAYWKVEEMYRAMEGTIDDDGFRYVSPDGTLIFPWSNLKRAVLFDRDFALVYRTEGYFLFLDRRFFRSDSEWLAVVRAVVDHLPVKVKRRALPLVDSVRKRH
jgi:hypothetical protein